MSRDNSDSPTRNPDPGSLEPSSAAESESAGLLDSLLRAFDERERKAAASEAASPPDIWATSRPAGRGPHESAERGGTIFTRSSTAASDIEALIKVAMASPDAEDAETDSVLDRPDRHEEIPEAVIDDPDVDEAVFEALSDAAEGDSGEALNIQIRHEHLESPGELRAPMDDVAAVEDTEQEVSDDWLTDLKPEQHLAATSEVIEPRDPEFDVDPASTDEPDPLTSPEMEEVLAADSMTPPSLQSFDDIFETDKSASVATPPSADPSVNVLAGPANSLDMLEATTVIEEIDDEHVSASAVRERAATPAPPQVSGKPVAAESKPAGRIPLPPSPLELMRAQPRRAAAAMAAALLVGGATFVFLAANRFRLPGAIIGLGAPVPLERAMRLSASLADEGDHAGALRVLDEAIGVALESDSHLADAKFQRLEVMVAAMPAELTARQAGALHSAIDEAIRDGRQHPRTSEALMWKAQVYERENNAVAARAEYRGILEDYGSAPNRDEVLLRLGQLELQLDRPEDAIAIAQRLLADYPRSPHANEAGLLLGDAHAAAGDAEAARLAYTRLAELAMDSPAGAQAFERLGKIAIESGEPDTAIRDLESRLQSATTVEGNERVYLVLARAYRASGQPEKARGILNELIDFFPESDITPLALAELSSVLAELGLDQEALRFAERTVERYPDHPEVLATAANLFASDGRHLDAGHTMQRAYGAGAKRPDVLLAAGRELALAGEPREAQAAFERTVLEFPAAAESIHAHIGWARAALEAGDVNEAYLRLREAADTTEGRPRQMYVLIALAELYRELGLDSEAIAAYAKVATVTDDPEALAEAARNLIDAGAADEGLAIARRVDVARLDPARAYPFLQSWGVAMLRANADQAADILQRAHDAYPDERTAGGVRSLMRAVLARGRTAQARAILAEMATRTAHSEYAEDRHLFASAAADYGDYLYARQDYSAAAETYAMASASPTDLDDAHQPTETEYWNAYQRANALFALGRMEESLPLFEFVAKSPSPISRDARARGDVARLGQRRIDGPPAVAPEGGGA